MGVTATSSRPYALGKLGVTKVNGVITARLDSQVDYGGSGAVEVTTSYRTGGRATGLSDADKEENELLSARTYGEVRALLYKQRNISSRSSFDNGHPFSTEKSWVDDFQSLNSKNFLSGSKYEYTGPVLPYGLGYGKFLSPASFDATYYGTKGIADTAPTQPVVSSLTALIELQREGLPSLLGAQISALRKGGLLAKLAKEFLNWEYGYKPLANDIAKAALACSEASRLLMQYERDSGEGGNTVRRSRHFGTEYTSTVRPETRGTVQALTNTTGVKPWVITSGAQDKLGGTLLCSESTSRRIWFKGSYMYLAGLRSKQNMLENVYERANHLLGLELNEDVIYSVTPWSWLIDWNLNLGDIIKNISNFQKDSLVLRYGYVMCETKTQRDYTLKPDLVPLSGPPGPFTASFKTLKKVRVKASPYGFALNPASYTTRQWAILSALGLSKGGPNSLP